MNYPWFKDCLVLAAIFAGGFSLSTTPAFCQTGTLAGYGRMLPQYIYGTTAAARNSAAWLQTCTTGPKEGQPVNPGLQSVLTSLNYSILRIPGGTGSNLWDWMAGAQSNAYGSANGGEAGSDSCPNTATAPTVGGDVYNCSDESPYLSPVGELEKELKTTGTEGDVNLNVLTNPECTVDPQTGYCAYAPPPSNNGPNEAYQKSFLEQLTSDNAPVNRIEMGNEMYFPGPNNSSVTVYPYATNYIDAVVPWIQDFRNDGNISSSYTYGVDIDPCGAFVDNCGTGDRRTTWNQDIFTEVAALQQQGYKVPDAVILHRYDDPNFTVNNPVINDTNAEAMLEEPFTTWNTLDNVLIPTLTGSHWTTTSNWNPNIWLTEFNLAGNGCQQTAEGTWANALFTATQGLLAVTESRIKEILHWEAQAPGATFPDIFMSNQAFYSSNYSNVKGIQSVATAVNGYTAQGLITRMIDTAALHQTAAQPLSISGDVLFQPDANNIRYPTLIGEVFATGTSAQIVILNLYNKAQTIDLSAVVQSGAYTQLSGDAGDYVDGKPSTNGYEAYKYDENLGKLYQVQVISTPSQTLTPTSLNLPAFSATQITATLRNAIQTQPH